MPGRKDQRNRELQRAEQSCSKLTNIFKKLKCFHCLRNTLKKGDYMCKLDLKHAFFLVLLNPASGKFVRFLCSGTLYEFFYPCFGLNFVLDATGQLFLLSMIMQMGNQLTNTQKQVPQSMAFLTTDHLSLDMCLLVSVESVSGKIMIFIRKNIWLVILMAPDFCFQGLCNALSRCKVYG